MSRPWHPLYIDKHGKPHAIMCHAWNGDKTKIAFCPNNSELHISKWNGVTFELEHVLREHDQVITSVDWGAKSNRIVTCSQDRNAYVWTFSENKWNPTLVLLRINRAATFVRWSPSEDRFAVATGMKSVCVCKFEEEHNWWASKIIDDKHGSTVLSIAWHPSENLLATGCCDSKCRIFSVPVKKPPPVFGNAKPSKFGTLEATLSCHGWVHQVQFSPSGNQLAFVGHDSSVNVVTLPTDRRPVDGDVKSVSYLGAPFRCVSFLNETTLVAAGHDCVPIAFVKSGDGWAQGKKLDTGSGGPSAAKSSAMSSAFKKFETASARAGEDSSSSQLDSIHQNCISELRVNEAGTGFTTTGIDGRCVFWDVASIESKLGKLSIA